MQIAPTVIKLKELPVQQDCLTCIIFLLSQTCCILL